MATISNLATSSLALKGAGTDYNYLQRFFATKAEADAALLDGSWVPVAGALNGAITGDQGFFVYNEATSSLDVADGATRAYIDAQIASVIDSSPEALDTLNELAAALGDDPDYFVNTNAALQANTNLVNAETARATAAEAALQADVDQNEADADAAIAAVQADVDQNEADADAAIAALQADVDQNEADADAAIAALQADVDQNESDADAAIAAVQADVDANEAAGLAAIAVVQADVDQNEADADAAIAALQADVDQNEADADAAIAAVQADVDQNEADADAAIAAVQADVDQNEADADAAIAAVQADVDQNEADADAAIAVERGRIDAILSGADADKDTFAEIVTLINSVDTTNDNAFAGYVASNDAAVAAVQADVDQNEADADAAIAVERGRIDAVEAEIDTARTNIYSALGQAEGVQAMGTFSGGTLSDNTTVRALLQELETATELRATRNAPSFSGDVTLGNGALYQAASERLGLGTTSPGARLHAFGTGGVQAIFQRLNGSSKITIKDNLSDDGMTIQTPVQTANALKFEGYGTNAGFRFVTNNNGTQSDRLLIQHTNVTSEVTLNAKAGFQLAGVDVTATAAELNFMDGVTSNVQTQLDNIQSDVNQNENDADAAIAAVQADVDANEAASDAAEAALSARLDTLEVDPTTKTYVDAQVAGIVDAAPGALNTLNELAAALGDDENFSTTITNSLAAIQADVDANETASDVAEAALSGRLDTLEADPTTATAVAAVQADVDQNEADADAAIAALQADVDQNEADADAAIAAVQADVDQNEADADAAIAAETTARTAAVAAVQADVDQNEADADAAIAAVQADVDQNEADADAAIAANEVHIDNLASLTGVAKDATDLGSFAGSTIADSSNIKAALLSLETSLETKANVSFVQNEIANVIDGAPGALNTLNEIAAALGDDENVATTLTNLINDNEVHIDNLATLLGIAKDGVNFSTFTGSTIGDNLTLKAILQQLETKVEAVQTDVDGNESDADAAIAAVQADVDQNEADADAAIAAVQADVDQNEADADAAIAAEATARATAITNLQADVDQNEADADAALALRAMAADSVLTGTTEAKGVLNVANDGGQTHGYYLKIQRNNATQLDILARNIPSGGNLHITNSNGNNARVIVLSDEFWVRNLGGVNGNGKARFDGEVVLGDSFLLGGTKVTATGAELNILDGVTATATELNLLDGVTATTAELNILDGVTATAAELNFMDGVTSNVQTQLDAKLSAETITMTAFKAVVAASSDFADFQSRVAAL